MEDAGDFVLNVVWSKTVPFSFNSLVVGPIFRTNHANLLFGSAEGKIRIFQNDKVRIFRFACFLSENIGYQKEEEILETKGGAVQAIVLHDVTKFGTTPSIEVIVGDVDGNVVIFSNFMIFRRHSVGHPILSLAVEVDVGTQRILCQYVNAKTHCFFQHKTSASSQAILEVGSPHSTQTMMFYGS